MATPLHVLIVEDSEDDLALLVYELEHSGYELTYERVETAASMSAALATKHWDVILSDYSLPTFSATAALKLLQETGIDLPFIIVSGTVGEDTAVAALKAGAHDFFAKQKLVRLIPAIEREIREALERRKRREAELQLRQSETRYHSLFKNVPIGLYRSSSSGEILDANPAMIKMLGYPDLPSLMAINANELYVTIESRNRWQSLMDHQGVVRDFEVLIKRFDSGLIWCVINTQAVKDDDGHVLYYEGSMQNVTERKQAEGELNALHNALSILFKADSLLSLGRQIVQAVVREFGQSDCGLMLVDREQKRMIRLARSGDYVVDTDTPLYLDGPGLVPEAVRTERMVYVPDVTEDPDYLAAHAQTRSELVIPLRTSKGIVGVLDLQSPSEEAFNQRDRRILSAFSERAAAALETMQLVEEINRHASELEWRVAERTAQLQHTKERVEAILNNSSDAIIVTEVNGIIQNANPAFTIMFGYQVDEMFKLPLTALIEPDDSHKLEEATRAVMDGQPSTRAEVMVRRADGTSFHADVVVSPVRRGNDHIAGIVCNVRDMTTRRQMEEELRLALAKEKELNELKSRFVSMVSHEFRTPLATILSSTDLLKIYGDRMTEERKQEHLTKLQLQVNHLTGLLEDVLTLGKAESVGLDFRPVRLDLEGFCRNLVEEVQQADAMAHQVNFKASGSCGDAIADEKLLRHIVFNLLSNAIKYSHSGGSVDFDLTCDASQATLRFKDEGIGIPEEDVEHLFEAFHRATNVGNISGTGLGLVIVKRAVDAHRGMILCESKVGVGTTFTVTLPIGPSLEAESENTGPQ